MFPPNTGRPTLWLAATSILGAGAAAGVGLTALGAPGAAQLRVVSGLAALGCALALTVTIRGRRTGLPRGAWWLAAGIVGSWVFALFALFAISFYLRFPVDFLNFWEGDFIGDIIKLRAGIPLYTEPTDNNSSVYTPGAQLLTYGLAKLSGVETSIPGLRVIQFSYAVLAALVATGASDLLAKRFLGPHDYAGRPLWLALWFPLLFLAATEPRFGYNIHALHPDSLTLLISAIAFWLLCRYAVTRSTWSFIGLALIPAVGFWSKQSLLIWGALTGLYLIWPGRSAVRRTVAYGALSLTLLVVSVAILFRVGGPQTSFFIFGVLGAKTVGMARSLDAFLTAGGFAAMAVAAFWLLVARDRSQEGLALWGVSAILFVVESYTTGIGWQKNHLGPGVLIAMAWFVAALPRAFRLATEQRTWSGLAQGSFVAGLLLLVTGLGLTRDPKNGVPADTERYIAAIEREFDGMDPRDVLLDRGNWVYVADTVLMMDRASSVQLWVGKNQPTITRELLVGTIERFQERRYRRILVRNLDGGSPYDYESRGSGVRDALLANYREVRRIKGVEVERWWPSLLLADISVLEPLPRDRPQ